MGAYQDVLCCAVKPNPQTDRTEPGLSGLLSTGGGTRGRLNKCASVCVCVCIQADIYAGCQKE